MQETILILEQLRTVSGIYLFIFLFSSYKSLSLSSLEK